MTDRRLDARVAELSDPGRGAIATLRVWGPDAIVVADAAFRPAAGRSLRDAPTGRLRVGRIGAGLGDEVVAVVVGRDPPEVEVQCHGGPAAVRLVADALVAAGAGRAPARLWARRALGSSLRVEAGEALGLAPTARTAAILLDQLDGALDAALGRVVAALDAGADDRARGDLDALIERGEVGVRLVAGWRVVLAGRPNVGKSRLLNALAGFDRAIVAAEAGTTRDVVTARTAFEGWPVELADTAGLRAEPGDAIEAAGMDLARARHRDADLVLIVCDRSAPLIAEDRAIRLAHPRALVVASKADLAPRWDASVEADLAVAAERGDGIAALGAAIVARLGIQAPPSGSGVPFRSRHLQHLRAARAGLDRGDRARVRRSLARRLAAGGTPRDAATAEVTA